MPEAEGVGWIAQNSRLQAVHIEHGATWLSMEHTCALRWLKELGLSTYTQYSDGMIVHGKREGSYQQIEHMGELYIKHRAEIEAMLKFVETLIDDLERLAGQLLA